MEVPYKSATTTPANPNACTWAVCYDIGPENYDDHKPQTRIIGVFMYPTEAEDFILHCMPIETRNRFYIVHI